jgi:hypothetical protein
MNTTTPVDPAVRQDASVSSLVPGAPNAFVTPSYAPHYLTPGPYQAYSIPQTDSIRALVDQYTKDKEAMKNLSDNTKQHLKEIQESQSQICRHLEETYNRQMLNEQYTDACVTLTIMKDLNKYLHFAFPIEEALQKILPKVEQQKLNLMVTKHKHGEKPFIHFESEKYKKVFACDHPAGLLESCDLPTSIPFYIGLSVCCRPFNTFLTTHHKILQQHFEQQLDAGQRKTFRQNHAYFSTISDNKSTPQHMHIYFLHRYLPENIDSYFAHEKDTFAPRHGTQSSTGFIPGITDSVPSIHYYRRLLLIASLVQFTRFLTILFLEVYTFHESKFMNLVNSSTLQSLFKENPVHAITILLKTLIFLSITNIGISNPTIKIPEVISYNQAQDDLMKLCTSNAFQKIILHQTIMNEVTYIDAMDYYDRKVYGVTAMNRIFNDIPNDESKKEFFTYFQHLFEHASKAWDLSWDITQPMLDRFYTCTLSSNVFRVTDYAKETKLKPTLDSILAKHRNFYDSIKEINDALDQYKKLDKQRFQEKEDEEQRIKTKESEIDKQLQTIRTKTAQVTQEEQELEQKNQHVVKYKQSIEDFKKQIQELERLKREAMGLDKAQRAAIQAKIDDLTSQIMSV